MFVNKNTNKRYSFLKVPLKIFKEEPYLSEMTHTAIVAYMFILNRLNLSKVNNLIDADGDIYIYYSVSQLQKELKTSRTTTINTIKLLKKLGLIANKEVEKGKSSKLYIIDIFDDDYEVVQNLDHTGTNFRPAPVQNLDPINIYYNNINKKYNTNFNFLNYEQRQYDNFDKYENK